MHVGDLCWTWLLDLLQLIFEKHLIVLSLSSYLTSGDLAHWLCLLGSVLVSCGSSLLRLSRAILLLNINLSWCVFHHLLILHGVELLLVLWLRACSIFDHCLLQIIAIWGHANASLELLKSMLLAWLQLVLLLHGLSLRGNPLNLHRVTIESSNLLNIDLLTMIGVRVLLNVRQLPKNIGILLLLRLLIWLLKEQGRVCLLCLRVGSSGLWLLDNVALRESLR